jgi:hypothetical protein
MGFAGETNVGSVPHFYTKQRLYGRRAAEMQTSGGAWEADSEIQSYLKDARWVSVTFQNPRNVAGLKSMALRDPQIRFLPD